MKWRITTRPSGTTAISALGTGDKWLGVAWLAVNGGGSGYYLSMVKSQQWGMGPRLVRKAIEVAKRRGKRYIILMCMPQYISYYESEGFEMVKSGGGIIIMRLNL